MESDGQPDQRQQGHITGAPVPSRMFLGERFDNSKVKDLLAICKEKKISLSRMRLAKDKFQVIAEEFKQ